MKKIFAGAIVCLTYLSCTKNVAEIEAGEASMRKYKDANISIVNVQGSATAANSTFTFNTEYETGLAELEVFKGATEQTLCRISHYDLCKNSNGLKSYRVTDTISPGITSFYLVKYKLQNGEVFYTPLYKLKATK
ncbi:MAG: hypothetical protein JWQ96_1548 [Segetibacter sp.]|nr:hypothetical protein [Segetibacter sp.]